MLRFIFKAYETIFENTTESDEKILLNESIGVITPEGQEPKKQNQNIFEPQTYTTEGRQANFYNFWNYKTNLPTENNISKIITLLQAFIQSSEDLTSETQIERNNFLYANAYITFIYQYFFYTPIYENTETGNVGNLPALVSNPNSPNYSEMLISLQVFAKTETLKGAGNYQIVNENGTVPDIETYLQYDAAKQNKGFIKSLCFQNFQDFVKLNRDENGNNLIINYRNKMANSDVLNNWCGCFAPASAILQEAGINVGREENTQCDPLCYKLGVIQKFEPLINGVNYGQKITCNRSVCIIDNISIIAYGNQGSITFSQVCAGCNEGGCLCYLDVTNNSLVDKIISGRNGMDSQVDFIQNCPNSICYVVEETTGDTVPVECSKINTPDTGELFPENEEGQATLAHLIRIKSAFWYVLIFVLVFFLLYISSLIEIKMRSHTKIF